MSWIATAEVRHCLLNLASKTQLLGVNIYLGHNAALASVCRISCMVDNTPISHLNLCNETLYSQSLFGSKGSPSPFSAVSVELQVMAIVLLSIIVVRWLLAYKMLAGT